MIKRLFKHALYSNWSIRRRFSSEFFKKVEDEISKSEQLHLGEIRFAVEASLDPFMIFKNVSARERGIQIFSNLRIWDTEDNTGVLIYLLLADKDIEIIADRGINKKVGAKRWEAICHEMEKHFREGKFEEGVLQGIHDISYLLAKHFPQKGFDNPDELPNGVVIV